MLTCRLPICQLKKPSLTNHNCETVYVKLRGRFGLNGPLCCYISIIKIYDIIFVDKIYNLKLKYRFRFVLCIRLSDSLLVSNIRTHHILFNVIFL